MLGYGAVRAARPLAGHVVVLVTSALLAACLGLGGEDARPTPTAAPTPTPIVMLEIVTPTPGPAVPPGPTPTATAETGTPSDNAETGGTPPDTYVVQPGDTLYGIAVKFNVDVQALIDANNISDPNNLLAGQILVIPKPDEQ